MSPGSEKREERREKREEKEKRAGRGEIQNRTEGTATSPLLQDTRSHCVHCPTTEFIRSTKHATLRSLCAALVCLSAMQFLPLALLHVSHLADSRTAQIVVNVLFATSLFLLSLLPFPPLPLHHCCHRHHQSHRSCHLSFVLSFLGSSFLRSFVHFFVSSFPRPFSSSSSPSPFAPAANTPEAPSFYFISLLPSPTDISFLRLLVLSLVPPSLLPFLLSLIIVIASRLFGSSPLLVSFPQTPLLPFLPPLSSPSSFAPLSFSDSLLISRPRPLFLSLLVPG